MTEVTEPRNDLEALLLARWQRSLELEKIGLNQSYFDLGGDSLALLSMLGDFERLYGMKLNLVDVLENPTIAGARRSDVRRLTQQEKAALRDQAGRIPSATVPDRWRSTPEGNGGVFGPQQPVLSTLLQDYSGMPDPCTLEDIAAEHIRTIRSEQGNGPYFLGGWSKHGLTAYECARQLTMQGEQVPFVVMFDSECNLQTAPAPRSVIWPRRFELNYQLLRSVPREELIPFLKERVTWISEKLRRKFVIGTRPARGVLDPQKYSSR